MPLRERGHHVASIGKLHFRGHPEDDYGFTESLLAMHITGGVGDVTHLAKMRKLMLDHIDEAGGFAGKLDAAVRRHFVLDSELQARISPQQQPSKTGKTR